MVRSSKQDIPPSIKLDARAIKLGIDRLKKRISDLQQLDPYSITDRSAAPEIDAIEVSIKEALAKTFGDGTSEYLLYSKAARIDRGPYNAFYEVQPQVFQKSINDSAQRSLALLAQAVRSLEEQLVELSDAEPMPSVSSTQIQPTNSRDVFIVHGHDDAAKLSVARYLETLGLRPVVLHEQPNRGRTIISKFLDEAANVGFAVVIMTPDDLGGKCGSEAQPRARQNVVFELGFFIGRLGSERVAALVKGQVETPSDFDAVVYISLDSGAWKLALGKELLAAGYDIDLNRVA